MREECMQSATSTSRLQHTAKLGVCGEMLVQTEATIRACEEQLEAAGAKTMASDEKKDSNKIPQISAVRQDVTTDRGHHWGHAKGSKRLLEPKLWQAMSA